MIRLTLPRFSSRCIAIRWALQDWASFYGLRWCEERSGWFRRRFFIEGAAHLEQVFAKWGKIG